MKEKIETLIVRELAEEDIAAAVQATRLAYAAVEKLLTDAPMFGGQNKGMCRGWLRYIAVMNSLSLACERKEFKSVTPRWKQVSSSLSRLYLETENLSVQTAHLPCIFDSVRQQYVRPKIGPTRELGIMDNQMLLPGIDSMLGSQALEGKFDVYFLHGNVRFDFFHIGIMDSLESASGYKYLSDANHALHVAEVFTAHTERVQELEPELIEETIAGIESAAGA